MAEFEYIAIDAVGHRLKGTMDAGSGQELLGKLEKKSLHCVHFEDISGKSKTPTTYKMKHKDVVIFCRQLKAMLTAGITISRIFDILKDRTTHLRQKRLYQNIYESLQMGGTLSGAMLEQGKSMPILLVQMIASGEASGTLDNVVDKMEAYYNNEMKLLSKMKTAMIYPLFLLAVAIGVIVLLFQVVMPNLFGMFEGATLSGSTKFLMWISNTLSEKWPFILMGFVLIILLLNGFYSTKKGRLFFDKLKTKIPMVGKLLKIIYTARFANSMATLYSSGVTVINALEISCEIMGNTFYTKEFAGITEQVRRGQSLAVSVESSGLFDPMFTSLIFIGEESGNLDQVLLQASDYYDTEAQVALERMVAMIEPGMIIILAVIIGFIVVSVITPIYSMYSEI